MNLAFFAAGGDALANLMPGGTIGDVLLLAALAVSLFSIGAGFAIIGGWLERKTIARVHSRIGPQYTGPAGSLQTVADAVKFLRKEVIFPEGSDRFLYRLAPLVLLIAPFLAFAVIPVGSLAVTDSPIALVIALALLGASPIAIIIGAWASNSKYSTLGGLRAAGMMMSYEVVLVLAAGSIALSAGTLSITGIAQYQAQHGLFIYMQPIAAILFIISLIASVERNPFDLLEAESELVGGWKTEYGGVWFSLTLLAEYLKLLASAFLFSHLFLGGAATRFGDISFLLGAGAVVLLMFVVRATAMRLRMDQILDTVWTRLIPLAILNGAATIVITVWLGGGF